MNPNNLHQSIMQFMLLAICLFGIIESNQAQKFRPSAVDFSPWHPIDIAELPVEVKTNKARSIQSSAPGPVFVPKTNSIRSRNSNVRIVDSGKGSKRRNFDTSTGTTGEKAVPETRSSYQTRSTTPSTTKADKVTRRFKVTRKLVHESSSTTSKPKRQFTARTTSENVLGTSPEIPSPTKASLKRIPLTRGNFRAKPTEKAVDGNKAAEDENYPEHFKLLLKTKETTEKMIVKKPLKSYHSLSVNKTTKTTARSSIVPIRSRVFSRPTSTTTKASAQSESTSATTRHNLSRPKPTRRVKSVGSTLQEPPTAKSTASYATISPGRQSFEANVNTQADDKQIDPPLREYFPRTSALGSSMKYSSRFRNSDVALKANKAGSYQPTVPSITTTPLDLTDIDLERWREILPLAAELVHVPLDGEIMTQSPSQTVSIYEALAEVLSKPTESLNFSKSKSTDRTPLSDSPVTSTTTSTTTTTTTTPSPPTTVNANSESKVEASILDENYPIVNSVAVNNQEASTEASAMGIELQLTANSDSLTTSPTPKPYPYKSVETTNKILTRPFDERQSSTETQQQTMSDPMQADESFQITDKTETPPTIEILPSDITHSTETSSIKLEAQIDNETIAINRNEIETIRTNLPGNIVGNNFMKVLTSTAVPPNYTPRFSQANRMPILTFGVNSERIVEASRNSKKLDLMTRKVTITDSEVDSFSTPSVFPIYRRKQFETTTIETDFSSTIAHDIVASSIMTLKDSTEVFNYNFTTVSELESSTKIYNENENSLTSNDSNRSGSTNIFHKNFTTVSELESSTKIYNENENSLTSNDSNRSGSTNTFHKNFTTVSELESSTKIYNENENSLTSNDSNRSGSTNIFHKNFTTVSELESSTKIYNENENSLTSNDSNRSGSTNTFHKNFTTVSELESSTKIYNENENSLTSNDSNRSGSTNTFHKSFTTVSELESSTKIYNENENSLTSNDSNRSGSTNTFHKNFTTVSEFESSTKIYNENENSLTSNDSNRSGSTNTFHKNFTTVSELESSTKIYNENENSLTSNDSNRSGSTNTFHKNFTTVSELESSTKIYNGNENSLTSNDSNRSGSPNIFHKNFTTVSELESSTKIYNENENSLTSNDSNRSGSTNTFHKNFTTVSELESSTKIYNENENSLTSNDSNRLGSTNVFHNNITTVKGLEKLTTKSFKQEINELTTVSKHRSHTIAFDDLSTISSTISSPRKSSTKSLIQQINELTTTTELPFTSKSTFTPPIIPKPFSPYFPSTTDSMKVTEKIVYAILPNNTVARKIIRERLTTENPYVVYGIFPNKSLVRKFRNGTIIPDDENLVEITDIDPLSLTNPGIGFHRRMVDNEIRKIAVATTNLPITQTESSGHIIDLLQKLKNETDSLIKSENIFSLAKKPHLPPISDVDPLSNQIDPREINFMAAETTAFASISSTPSTATVSSTTRTSSTAKGSSSSASPSTLETPSTTEASSTIIVNIFHNGEDISSTVETDLSKEVWDNEIFNVLEGKDKLEKPSSSSPPRLSFPTSQSFSTVSSTTSMSSTTKQQSSSTTKRATTTSIPTTFMTTAETLPTTELPLTTTESFIAKNFKRLQELLSVQGPRNRKTPTTRIPEETTTEAPETTSTVRSTRAQATTTLRPRPSTTRRPTTVRTTTLSPITVYEIPTTTTRETTVTTTRARPTLVTETPRTSTTTEAYTEAPTTKRATVQKKPKPKSSFSDTEDLAFLRQLASYINRQSPTLPSMKPTTRKLISTTTSTTTTSTTPPTTTSTTTTAPITARFPTTYSDADDVAFLNSLRQYANIINLTTERSGLANRILELALNRSPKSVEQKPTDSAENIVQQIDTTREKINMMSGILKQNQDEDLTQKLSQAEIDRTKQMLQRDISQYNKDIKLLSLLVGKPVSNLDISKLAAANLGRPSVRQVAISSSMPTTTAPTRMTKAGVVETTTTKAYVPETTLPEFKPLSARETKFLEALQQIQTTKALTTSTTTAKSVSQSQEALIAALLKQQGIGPNDQIPIEKILEQLPLNNLGQLTSTTIRPFSPLPALRRQPRPLLDGLAWLWKTWQDTAPGPKPQARPQQQSSSLEDFGNFDETSQSESAGGGQADSLGYPAQGAPLLPGGLLGAALGVTRAVTQFLGVAFAGAGQAFQTVISAGSAVPGSASPGNVNSYYGFSGR